MARSVKDLRDIISVSRLSLCTDGGGGGGEANPRDELMAPTPCPDDKIDAVLAHIDATLINDYLARAERLQTSLRRWWNASTNSVRFVHFWLVELRDEARAALVRLEAGIVRAELDLAFRVAKASGDVVDADIDAFHDVVFHEYPKRLCGRDGARVLLRLVACVGAGTDDSSYTRLLATTRCATKAYAERATASRAFALIAFACAVVKFFVESSSSKINDFKFDVDARRRPVDGRATSRLLDDLLVGTVASRSRVLTDVERTFQAVEIGSVAAVRYFLCERNVDGRIRDGRGRTLVSVAILKGREHVLTYLLTDTDARLTVDEPIESGNCPLHVAAREGHVPMVQDLILAGADANRWNPESDGATPLHLAVMHDHPEVVTCLLENGADKEAKMGVPATVTPLVLAEDLGHDAIATLLREL